MKTDSHREETKKGDQVKGGSIHAEEAHRGRKILLVLLDGQCGYVA